MFRKQKAEVKEETAVTTEPKRGAKAIDKVWNPELTKYEYALYSYNFLTMGLYIGTIYCWQEIARGNKTWAEKNAKHYGIEINEDD